MNLDTIGSFKLSSIFMLLLSLLISITLGVYNFGFDNSPKVSESHMLNSIVE